ncbi:MAG: hypothetical protein HC883_01240 [Bdellovibrionaceae bacterium]|nr:hypothetical protein [Pseudobdellovibrionaceae bacterium]
MPSEKSPYLERNRGPTPPIDFDDLRKHLPSLGSQHLAELLWVRAQQDDVLAKALTASVAIRSAQGDWQQAKDGVDYDCHFPDFIRYTEGGHGMILDEIKNSLDFLSAQGQIDSAIRIAEHAIQRGQEVAENFEDDWDWISSLKDLMAWVEKPRGGT